MRYSRNILEDQAAGSNASARHLRLAPQAERFRAGFIEGREMRMRRHVFLMIGAVILGQPALAQSTASLDDIVRRLDVAEVKLHPNDRDADATAILGDGRRFELDFQSNGRLEDIEAQDGALIPVASLGTAIPEALRSAPRWPADASFEEIEFERDGVEITGVDAAGMPFKARFSNAGDLIEWKSE